MIKIYKCCICHKVLEDKPIRLVKQKYAIGERKRFYNVSNYNFCKECYRKFNNWIIKHKKTRAS